MRKLLFSLLLALALATPALASDGVLEINQTCAVQTGCFDGDPPGFPVLITGVAGKSYRLTSDLAVGIGNHDTDGIFINTARITLDLNGFTMSGSKFLSSTGTGVAINGGTTVGTAASFLTLKDGSIRGWAGGAVSIREAESARIEDVGFDFNDGNAIETGDRAQIFRNRISDGGANAVAGIVAGDRSSILENNVQGMTFDGVRCGQECKISGNTVSLNGGHGIEAEYASVVSENTASGNGSDGIHISPGTGSTISGNSVFNNGDDGIEVASDSVVRGNAVHNNAVDQIEAGARSSVIGNTATASTSTGWGLKLLSTAGYVNNVIGNSGLGSVSNGINAGGNVCNGSLTCP